MKEHSVQVPYSAAGISIAMFNFIYLTSSGLLYTSYLTYPSGIIGCNDCSKAPYTSSYYKDQMTAFNTKVAIFLFAFVQIWVGLVLLPACIFLIIAPLQTIPVFCAAIAFPSLLMAFIAILLQFANKLHIRYCNYKINAMVCIHSSRHMVFVALIVAVMTLYFNLSPGGTTLSSTK